MKKTLKLNKNFFLYALCFILLIVSTIMFAACGNLEASNINKLISVNVIDRTIF